MRMIQRKYTRIDILNKILYYISTEQINIKVVKAMENIRARENKARRKLAKEGYSLHKSRARLSIDNLGGYMISNDNDNTIVAGEKYDLSIEDVEKFIEN